MEPNSVAIGGIVLTVGGSVLSFARSLGDRLGSRYIKTPLEESYGYGVDVQRRKLFEDRKRYSLNIKEERNRHIREINSRIALQNHIKSLSEWPLTVSAYDLIQRSSANNNKALNIFINIRSEKIAPITALITHIVCDIEIWLQTYYSEYSSSHPVIPYLHSLKKRDVTRNSFVTTVFSGLKYEPVLTLDIHCVNSSKIRIYASFWGFGEYYASPQTYIFTLECLGNDDDHANIAAYLRTYIALIIDIYHLTCRIDNPVVPIIDESVLFDINAPFSLSGNAGDIVTMSPIDDIYMSISPNVGIDISLKYANELHKKGRKNIAIDIFTKLCNRICRESDNSVNISSWDDVNKIEQINHPMKDNMLSTMRTLKGIPSSTNIPICKYDDDTKNGDRVMIETILNRFGINSITNNMHNVLVGHKSSIHEEKRCIDMKYLCSKMAEIKDGVFQTDKYVITRGKNIFAGKYFVITAITESGDTIYDSNMKPIRSGIFYKICDKEVDELFAVSEHVIFNLSN